MDSKPDFSRFPGSGGGALTLGCPDLVDVYLVILEQASDGYQYWSRLFRPIEDAGAQIVERDIAFGVLAGPLSGIFRTQGKRSQPATRVADRICRRPYPLTGKSPHREIPGAVNLRAEPIALRPKARMEGQQVH